MNIKRFLSLIGLVFILALGLTENATGTMNISGITSKGPIDSTPCYPIVFGMDAYAGGEACWWNIDSTSSGKIYVYTKTTFTGADFAYNAAGPLGQSYVPYTSTWKLMYYICPLTPYTGNIGHDSPPPLEACTLNKATLHYESTSSVSISSSQNINDQNADFTTGKGVIPANSSICYALKDVNHPDVIWRSNDARMCADAHALPDKPSACYLNYQETLNVDLGTLERGEIATIAHPGDKGNVIKPVQVLCVRDGGVTVKTTFKYTSISVNSVGVVSTSNSGIGVAIIYKGETVQPSSSFEETFSTGYTTVNLEFEAVRDQSVPISQIPTGAFTANAVMIMTEQ